MRITITARHCEIPDELRARARERLERLARIAPRPHDGRVVFVADHGRPTVEVRLHTGRGAVHVGTARGADHRTALDLAVAKVRRQLDKDPTRRTLATARSSAVRCTWVRRAGRTTVPRCILQCPKPADISTLSLHGGLPTLGRRARYGG